VTTRDRRMLLDLRAFVEVLDKAPAQVPDATAAWRAVREMHAVLHPSATVVQRGLADVAARVRDAADPEPGSHSWGPWRDQGKKDRAKTLTWLVRELRLHVHPAFTVLEKRGRVDVRVAELLDAYAPRKHRGRKVAARIAAELVLMAGAWEQRETAGDRRAPSTPGEAPDRDGDA
jgi:hypothetical protein